MRSLDRRIVSCQACPRLRAHCLKVAKEKRRAFLQDTYWGKPITGFGDPNARIMVVGLAPAAHGANRTGRIFTGDRSGEWLYRALYRAGFSNQPHSVAKDDGLQLNDVFVSCIVRCAPPQNRPLPVEIKRCSGYLENEITLLPRVRVWIALGGLALQGLWPALLRTTCPEGSRQSQRPRFGHGLKIPLGQGQWLLQSYHPSQQNTFTGRLTQDMFDSVFNEAKKLLQNAN